MADRAAAEKKQSGKSLTIREVLEAQGGNTWYAPKASPNRHHIWLRKAFNGIFAPFIFDKPTLVDQRCNSISPLEGIDWKEIAAVLTSSLFAYSLEINGAASMGAGALEASTTKLRSYPVLDLNELKAPARKTLVSLAEKVWSKETPYDWLSIGTQPSPELKALDRWIVKTAGRDLDIDSVYTDLQQVCRSRIVVAKDKAKKAKKKQTDNIGNVAESIAKTIQAKVHLKNFPEDFLSGSKPDIDFYIDRRTLKYIGIERFLGSCDVEIVAEENKIVYQGTHPSAVAEAIGRALLWGRSSFSISSNAKAMDVALTAFLTWAAEIEKDISSAISESALGTGYEETLSREIYTQLGIHPLASSKTLPARINFVPQA